MTYSQHLVVGADESVDQTPDYLDNIRSPNACPSPDYRADFAADAVVAPIITRCDVFGLQLVNYQELTNFFLRRDSNSQQQPFSATTLQWKRTAFYPIFCELRRHFPPWRNLATGNRKGPNVGRWLIPFDWSARNFLRDHASAASQRLALGFLYSTSTDCQDWSSRLSSSWVFSFCPRLDFSTFSMDKLEYRIYSGSSVDDFLEPHSLHFSYPSKVLLTIVLLRQSAETTPHSVHAFCHWSILSFY